MDRAPPWRWQAASLNEPARSILDAELTFFERSQRPGLATEPVALARPESSCLETVRIWNRRGCRHCWRAKAKALGGAVQLVQSKAAWCW